MSDWQLPHGAELKRVAADSVPYGTDIATRGKCVWVVVISGEIKATGATARQPRDAFRRVYSDI